MSWIDAIRHRLRVLVSGTGYEREMDEEVRAHLDLETLQRTHEGASDADARAAARRRFGNVTMTNELRRDAAGLAAFDRIRQDAGYAIRQLSRAPAFSLAVVITLALGIGANVTMFAIVDRIMLRVPEGITGGERIGHLRSRASGRDDSRISSSMSYPSYAEFRGMTGVFERVTAVQGPRDVPIDRGPSASMVRGALVADDYFPTLGVRPARGRFFASEETNERAGSPVVVLSFPYWQRRFGGSSEAIGRSLTIDGAPYTIIGVAPRGFVGHSLAATDIWIPFAAARGLRFGGDDWANDRRTRGLQVIVRLRDGVTPEQALARVATGWTAWNIRPERAGQNPPEPVFASLVPGESDSRPEHRVARLLTVVSLLLLLIAAANVANLLLARAIARRREIAIRLSLGMSRARLFTLFIIDGVILALLGGAAALLVARWSIPVVRSVLLAGTPAGHWPVDMRAVLVTLVIAIVTGVAAGIVPALQASRRSVSHALHNDSRSGVPRSNVRTALLFTQAALSLTLLAGTGLFVRSLQRIGDQQLGLDLDRVLVAEVKSSRDAYTPAELGTLYERMRERARLVPGVSEASLSVGVPFWGQYAFTLRLPGHDSLDSLPGMPRGHAPFIYAVTPDFFRTIGTRILQGRGFSEADDPGRSVAVVNQEMARLFWPAGNAIGQCFEIEPGPDSKGCTEVVGIAEDARRQGIIESSKSPQYYVPLAQAPDGMDGPMLLVRADQPARVKAALRRTLQNVDAELPYVELAGLSDLVAPELRPWRLGATLFAVFGALALLVAAVGMYSVTQFGVAQQFREMGVRIALGARRTHVVRLVLGGTLRVVVTACTAGIVLVLCAGGSVRSLLFETSPRDPIVLGLSAAVLILAAVIATLLPAWRATRIDPMVALRLD